MRTCAKSGILVFPVLFALLTAHARAGSCPLQAAKSGELSPCKLRALGKDIRLSISPLTDGREVYVPLDALTAIGCSFSLTTRDEAAVVTFPSGAKAEIALARPRGKSMLPLSAVKIHLDVDVTISSGVCDVLARLTHAAFEKGVLRLDTSLPLSAAAKQERGPDRTSYSVTISGATIPENFHTPKISIGETRITSLKIERCPGGVLVVLVGPAGVSFELNRAKVGREHMISATDSPRHVVARAGAIDQESRTRDGTEVQKAEFVERSIEEPLGRRQSGQGTGISSSKKRQGAATPRESVKTQTAEDPSTPRSNDDDDKSPNGVEPGGGRNAEPVPNKPSTIGPVTVAPPKAGAAAAIKVFGLSLVTVDASHARLKIETVGRAAPNIKLVGEPPQLFVDISNSVLATEQKEWEVDHPLVKAVRADNGPNSKSTRIILDLARVVGYSLLGIDKNCVVINISVPRGGGGLLFGKTIVIDAGHGGSPNCNNTLHNGKRVYEKDITLAIAKIVARKLDNAGVNVLMTRNSDVHIELSDRPKLANDNNAHLFVSLHVDDCSRPNTASGTTSYYHFDDESSRALAHSIQEHIVRVSGLPSRRARSDRERFPTTGMAVLHHCAVPATLIEMGYLNNVRDRTKLLDPDFQEKIAQAIFEGIRSYIEGSEAAGGAGEGGTR